MRNCPQLRSFNQVSIQPASPPASVPIRPNRATSVQASGGGTGTGSGSQGQEPARVFALTRQDAQASNAVMTGTLFVWQL